MAFPLLNSSVSLGAKEVPTSSSSFFLRLRNDQKKKSPRTGSSHSSFKYSGLAQCIVVSSQLSAFRNQESAFSIWQLSVFIFNCLLLTAES
jgi:hypothetical protein